MSLQSTSKTFNLKELFENNFFTIPDYQRGYSWEESQVKDLIKDIENINISNHKHYTGTIVAAETAPYHYELVDGQQRLTTLVILINEFHFFDPETFNEAKKFFLRRGIIGNEKAVLTPNVETRVCFNQAILNNKNFYPTIKSHQAILQAKAIFRKWLLSKQDNLRELYQTVTEKLSFLFFTPAQDKEIGIMFEVINNRGKELSELEKIKNFFIYYATIHDRPSLRIYINDQWVFIQTSLSQAQQTSNEEEKAFLRYCYLVFFKTSKEKSYNVYEECKIEFDVNKKESAEVDKNIGKMRDFISFIADAALHYSWWFNANYFQNSYQADEKEALGKCLTYLRCQPVSASIMPLYLSIMSRLDQPTKAVRLLQILEVLNMRLYILLGILNRADSNQAVLFNFAYEFYNDRDWHASSDPETTTFGEILIKGDIFEWLTQNMIQTTLYFCDAQVLNDSLILPEGSSTNFYRWQGLRYFLACYEENLRKTGKRSFDIQRIKSGKALVGENFNDQLSLEHIWASKNMVEDFPEDFHTKRRLGNFVLCGLVSNIKLSMESIPEKINSLLTNLPIADGTLDLLQVARLPKLLESARTELGNKRQTKNYWRDLANLICNQRELDFQTFALKRWAIPGDKPVQRKL